MGIPRLSQDVTPYAEAAILSKAQPHNTPSTLLVSDLVIDGPSLIYHVYNAILRSTNPSTHGYSNFNSNFARLPSYAHINACLDQFLQDLTKSGTHIQSIIFDGALPVTKRTIRLERLEKVRSGLDTYRKLWSPGGVRTSVVNPRPLHDGVNTLQDILWNTTPSSTHQHLLPPPPFMVASAIEYLQKSSWSHVTTLVPDEADSYCAIQAQATGAAVLSNDSDLLLYDLGSNGNVVMLKTLQRVDSTLKCLCLRPTEIARQLGVSSLLELGFQRFKDSSVTTSVIVQRTRMVPTEDDSAWIAFRAEYRPTPPIASSSTSVSELRDLDPRTSELLVSLHSGTTLNMYLPIVLEDPTRDAAWSYGREIRQLAYTLLLHTHKQTCRRKSQYSYVTEYSRKGPRIAETRVEVLSNGEMLDRTKTVNEMVESYLARETGPGAVLSVDERTLRYHLLSAAQVVQQYIHLGKPYRSHLTRLFPQVQSTSSTTLSWEDLHFLAAIQCTLYSFRVLRQVLGYIDSSMNESGSEGSLDVDVSNNVQRLKLQLADMPSLSDLFLDLPNLHAMFSRFPHGMVAEQTMRMIERVDPGAVKVERERDQNLGRGVDSKEWVDGTRKSEKKRKREGVSANVGMGGKGGGLKAVDARAMNPFALLDQDGDDD